MAIELVPYYSPQEYIEIIDAVPQQQRIKKQVFEKGEWKARNFFRIPVRHADKIARGDSKLEEWCYKHYNEPEYLGRWFKVSGYIILDEQTYVHWKLCE